MNTEKAPQQTAKPAWRDIDWTMALAVWRRNLIVYRRTWTMNILPNFFEPLLYLLSMGFGVGTYLSKEAVPSAYLAFVASGLLASAAMNGATFEVTYNMYVKMNFAKLYDAFLHTPAAAQDIAAGELLWALTRSMIYGVGFIVVLLGFQIFGIPLFQSYWAFCLPLALALIGTLFSLLGQVFTSYVKNIDWYSYYYTLFILPLMMFSGVFYPVENMPAGAQIAWMTPLYHGVRLCRALSSGTGLDAALSSTVWMLVVCIALWPWVPAQMRRRLVR